ncbi:hypothetical protein [Pseudoxanthomonas winnipegensis]|jgi:hypothetical protein|uniref:Uncharacterized protein n=1 Tax=Pseudoxanthomonas winnipegensis TaxID=2480810 RepID=A0A4Q8LD63_9GAMM|nr:hypothetical protein [Pseudoxanthomonas winnipegensis]TAA26500.1 hypothetical protein EA660_04490 [Pseudoxanthomonas winnipegensis]HCH0556870.1 hypothetical protein [Pseudomonas aeruginosa]
MRLLTSMFYCMLALFGCHDGSSSTSITRSQRDGVDTLFSRTTREAGSATFQCVRSASGRCHYQLFEETCRAGTGDKRACARTSVDQFSLGAGEQRVFQGLDMQVRECVQAEAPGPGTRCAG